MPEYIRTYVPGGTFFFTLVTHRRRALFSSPDARSCLREAILGVQRERPFRLVASVLLPDHFHCIWILPEVDGDYSKRWGIIKSRFSQLWLARHGDEIVVSPARAQHHERGIWQKRFWEHRIRNEEDFIHHVNYIHYDRSSMVSLSARTNGSIRALTGGFNRDSISGTGYAIVLAPSGRCRTTWERLERLANEPWCAVHTLPRS